MEIVKDTAQTVAKRITRKLCIVNDMHWHELLQHENDICKPEDSWSFRNWITFLLRLTGVDWPEEQKRQFFRDAEKISREDRDKIIIKQ